jgi:hypothetical protein
MYPLPALPSLEQFLNGIRVLRLAREQPEQNHRPIRLMDETSNKQRADHGPRLVLGESVGFPSRNVASFRAVPSLLAKSIF